VKHYPSDIYAHDPPCRACKRKGRGDVWHHWNSKQVWSESEGESEHDVIVVPDTVVPKASLWKRFKKWKKDPTRPELLPWRGAQGRQRGDV